MTATAGLASGVTDRILSLPGWLVLALVFAFPALEASAFVGFVFPGEIAVILGGVAASRGMVPLWAVIAAAVSGAIVGDSVGYLIGRRWGTHLLHGTVGRLPVFRTQLDKHLDAAQAYVKRRKGRAVFFGRFTAALRVLVPGLAGISEVHYPTFLVYNIAGGGLWGTGFAVLGYLAGASYHRVERIASQAGLILLGVIVAGLIASRLVRRFAVRSPGLTAAGDRLAATPPLAWLRHRFPAQVGWGRRRLDARSPRGFWLTFTVAAAALAAWAFGGLTQDVTGHDDAALADPHVTAWVTAHRAGWLTGVLEVLTWLGSTAFVIPAALAAGLYFVIRHRDWRPLALLAAAVAGAIGLYNIVKPLVGRPRPPAAIWIGHYTGAAFPSGHATQSAAFYIMLAIVLGAGLSSRRRTAVWGSAALIVLIVGASRIYLGAHWLTDVLAGYALGTCWAAIVVTVLLAASPGAGRARPASEQVRHPPGHHDRRDSQCRCAARSGPERRTTGRGSARHGRCLGLLPRRNPSPLPDTPRRGRSHLLFMLAAYLRVVRALVVEDEVRTAALLRRGLLEEGYAVDVAVNGPDAVWQATEFSYDVVILDVMLPGFDGLEVCRRLRCAGCWVPVLMLTAMGGLGERVHGLDAGADDYLAKPFSFDELFARLRALIRRGARERPAVLQVGDLRLDPATRQVWRGDTELELSPKEFALLELFLRYPGQVMTRTRILEHAWDFAYDGGSNVVDQYVRYLRRKVERPFGLHQLETVRGVGYRLRSSPQPGP